MDHQESDTPRSPRVVTAQPSIAEPPPPSPLIIAQLFDGFLQEQFPEVYYQLVHIHTVPEATIPPIAAARSGSGNDEENISSLLPEFSDGPPIVEAADPDSPSDDPATPDPAPAPDPETGAAQSWIPPLVTHPIRPHRRYHKASLSVRREHVDIVRNSAECARISLQMPATTIRDWRLRLNGHPDHFSMNARALTDLEEHAIVEILYPYYIDLMRLLTPKIERVIILNFVRPIQDATPKNIRPKLHKFTCRDSFLIRFNKRARLSLRKFTKARRDQVRQEDVDHFLLTLSNIRSRYPGAFILNMDETAWFLSMSPKHTLAPLGAQEVQVADELNPKSNFTAIGTVALDGTRYPMIFIAKGKTTVCHKQFRKGGVAAGALPILNGGAILHSSSGWTDEAVMLGYLDWLRATVHSSVHQRIVLILDNFAAHSTQAVRAKARALGIELEFVPANGTGSYQPLDRKIYGPLKRKGGSKWVQWHQIPSNLTKNFTLYDSGTILSEAWGEITQETILSGWNISTESLLGDIDAIPDDDGDDSPLYFEL